MWDDSDENKRFLRFSLTRKRQIPRVILYCAYAPKQGYETVRIRSPDSDIFFILLHHVSKFDIKILLDTGSGTGSGNNGKFIDISDLSKVYGQELCTALMSLHAFTHCDTSAFKGIGKIRPIKLLLKNKGFQDALSKLGDTWEVPAKLNDKLEEFTTAMYGRGMYKSVNPVRLDMLRAKCGAQMVSI